MKKVIYDRRLYECNKGSIPKWYRNKTIVFLRLFGWRTGEISIALEMDKTNVLRFFNKYYPTLQDEFWDTVVDLHKIYKEHIEPKKIKQ